MFVFNQKKKKKSFVTYTNSNEVNFKCSIKKKETTYK